MPSWWRAPLSPFSSEVDSVPLQPDPIVMVVAQVQFTPVLSVREQSFVAGFQEAIRRRYPLLHREVRQQAGHSRPGGAQTPESVIWRFSDVSDTWRVSLSEGFVSLDCSDYSHRMEFRDRFRKALDAVGAHIRPVLASRVGVRYTNRLSGPAFERLTDFIRPELLGLVGADFKRGKIISQLTEAEFSAEDVSLRGRWGCVLPHTTPDPSIPASEEPSWLLDLDAFLESVSPFDAASCAREAEFYAATVYRFFRWAVSDEFLEAYAAT